MRLALSGINLRSFRYMHHYRSTKNLLGDRDQTRKSDAVKACYTAGQVSLDVVR